jgi:hypothetical protein
MLPLEAATRADAARPPEHHVRHCFWKYPLIALAVAIAIAVVALAVGSPNAPRDTIAGVTQKEPGGAVLAFTQELDGTAASWANHQERGVGLPSETFVLGPAEDFAPLLGSQVQSAVQTYRAASAEQQQSWAKAYDQALDSITPKSEGAGAMEGTPSPDYAKLGTLQGDFGPVPLLVQTDLTLAQEGHLDHYLLSQDPGHSLHLQVIWLYDHPSLLNTATALGLTDDQWGMVKERGFSVGPWYLAIPAIVHIKLPGGEAGTGFTLWNLLFALLFLFVVPLVPGVRDLPRYLRLYRFMYRYPTRKERIPGPKQEGGDGS